MGARSLNKEDPEAIRMVFQRLCENEEKVELTFGKYQGAFPVLAENPDRVILGFSALERGQWGLKPGAHLALKLLDRGLPFEAVVEFEGFGRLQGVEASHITLPRILRALDTHRLADYVPDRPVPCPFSDQQNNVRDGHVTAFGEDGLELAPPEGVTALGDVLRLNAQSSVELRAALGEPMTLEVRVAYFGERIWGLRFLDSTDPARLGRYRQWLLEAMHQQAQRDRARFSLGGLEARSLTGSAPPGAAPASAQLLVDRDPLVLVLAEGTALPARLAESLGRKLGFAGLDRGKGPLRPLFPGAAEEDVSWGRIRLVLINHRVRGGSALEWCRRLVVEEKCPLPIVLVGTEEDEGLKRNRAVAAGAVDYLVVDPFHALRTLKALEDILQQFA